MALPNYWLLLHITTFCIIFYRTLKHTLQLLRKRYSVSQKQGRCAKIEKKKIVVRVSWWTSDRSRLRMLITKIPRRPKRQNKSEYGRRGVRRSGSDCVKRRPENKHGCIIRKAKERPSKAAINTIKYRAKIGFFRNQFCCCCYLEIGRCSCQIPKTFAVKCEKNCQIYYLAGRLWNH